MSGARRPLLTWWEILLAVVALVIAALMIRDGVRCARAGGKPAHGLYWVICLGVPNDA